MAALTKKKRRKKIPADAPTRVTTAPIDDTSGLTEPGQIDDAGVKRENIRRKKQDLMIKKIFSDNETKRYGKPTDA